MSPNWKCETQPPHRIHAGISSTSSTSSTSSASTTACPSIGIQPSDDLLVDLASAWVGV